MSAEGATPGGAPSAGADAPGQAALTWAALLAHWTDFARASLALPAGAEGDRWRAAAAPIIGLQAVTFALGDLDRLAGADHAGAGERAVALDRAEVLVRRHGRELEALWAGSEMPALVRELADDARAALEAARHAGVEWRVTAERLVTDHPGELLGVLGDAGFVGDLWLPVPGAALFAGAPAAFARGPAGGDPGVTAKRAVKEFLVEVSRPLPVPGPRQVYRQFDFAKGRAVRDLVAPLAEHAGTEVPAGQPQLVRVLERGAPRPVTLPIRGMADIGPVPVEFAGARARRG
ncbi:MAG TPA: hypothetical protein VD963_06925 [Phycisphaerales bacterium]|nr:hypothetical protein [Phycisphaerales bacterium]